MAKLNVKSGDLVEIIVGNEDNKGKRGRIISVDREKHLVTVEGLNLVKKHRKPRSAQDQGGIIDKPRAIDVSNVMLVCPKCKKTTRVGHVLNEKGKYVRCCKHEDCKAVIDVKEVKEAKKATKARAPRKTKKAEKTEE